MISCEQFISFFESNGLPLRTRLKDLTRPEDLQRGGKNRRVAVPDTRFVPGQTGPFEFVLDEAPELLPPAFFFAEALVDPKPKDNHAEIKKFFVQQFGKARDGSSSNCIESTWEFGNAGLELGTWPPQLNAWDPQFKSPYGPTSAATRIRLTISPRPPLTLDEERIFGETLALQIDGNGASVKFLRGDWRWEREKRGALRYLPQGMKGRSSFLGIASDSKALVGRSAHHGLIIPKADLLGFRLERVKPGPRSRGGATFYAKFKDPWSLQGRAVQLVIATAAAPPVFNKVAEKAAALCEVPLTASDYSDD